MTFNADADLERVFNIYYEDGKVRRLLKDLRFKHEAEFDTEIARKHGELGL